MSLRKKLALAFFLAVATFVGLDHVLHRANFAHRFHQEDVANGIRFGQVIQHQLRSTTTELERVAQSLLPRRHGVLPDWPADDEEFLETLGLDVLIVTDPEGWVHYHQILGGSPGQPRKIRALPNERIGAGHPISQAWRKLHEDDAEVLRFSGLMMTDAGPLALGASRQTPTGSQGMAVVTGRFLTLDKLNHPSLVNQGSVRIEDARALLNTVEGAELIDDLLSSSSAQLAVDTGETVESYSLLVDITGAPMLVCTTETPRDMGVLWSEIDRSASVSMIGIVLAFPFALMLLIQWIVTGPLRRLTNHSARIADNQSTTERLNMQRSDEIGQLAREFDQMLDQLQASRREVIETARQAGKADISMRVLHNVGNMLNHAAVGADLNRDAVRELPLRDLDRIADLLLEHQDRWVQFLTEDPRGQRLPQYLRQLSDDLQSRTQRLEQESFAVSDRIADIAKLVQDLDGNRTSHTLREEQHLGKLIENVVNMVTQTVEGAEQVTLVREFNAKQPVRLDPQKFLEIVFQVLANAIESALLAGAEPQVAIRAVCQENGTLHLEVADNGLGIDAADLTQVFQTGYTLKAEGSGLGLHLASTAAMELGGRLWAESTGLGYGAQFHLELPHAAAHHEPHPPGLAPHPAQGPRSTKGENKAVRPA